jgi:hypothetical protein
MREAIRLSAFQLIIIPPHEHPVLIPVSPHAANQSPSKPQEPVHIFPRDIANVASCHRRRGRNRKRHFILHSCVMIGR